LSARSVYQRFFHPVTELGAEDLRRLTEIDFRDHVAIVLTDGRGCDERLIAVGQYVRVLSGGDVAEVAFTVVDEYQHRGAATLLLRELVACARQSGVHKLVALVLPDNLAMLAVFRRSRRPASVSLVDGLNRVVLSLDVSERGRHSALRSGSASGARSSRVGWSRQMSDPTPIGAQSVPQVQS
jgi:GNAT superfamily N-acetyltransferase